MFIHVGDWQVAVVAVDQLMTSLLLSRSSDDVREQLPRVDESVVLCPLSRRQHFVYSNYLAHRLLAHVAVYTA